MHTLSAKCPTLNCDSSFRFGRASFVDRSKNCRKYHLRYHEVKSVVSTNCCRNDKKSWPMHTLSRSWLGIIRRVDVMSYKIFAMVVACKKEVCRETIVDQRDVNIGKAADAVAQTEYVCEELSTKIRSGSLHDVKQMKDCAQKLGISSSCVRSITMII